jgi:hypothetical protein
MKVTISLIAETERSLLARAIDHGLSLDDYLQDYAGYTVTTSWQLRRHR